MMGWRNVIITQHSKLSYSYHMMVVQTTNGINKIPIEDINLLLVSTSQAVITSNLISELAKNHSKVIFVDDQYLPVTETCDYYFFNKTKDRILEQINWDQTRVDSLWTKIVYHKITNQAQVLDNYGIDCQPLLDERDKIEMGDVTNREAVAARKYFVSLFGSDFARGKENPTNAALDYGYAILLSSFTREIAMQGYLTQLGIHHRSNENNFNLSSDLMEPFRPFIDYWVKGQHVIKEFSPDIKYGLVELLSLEIVYHGKHTLLSNAIQDYVRDVIGYLKGTKENINLEMELTHEVPNDAINDNV